MTRDIILHTEAEIEILQAVEWYAERSLLATRAFIYELNGVIVRAARSPDTWPRTFGNARRIVFPNFPFDLVFRRSGERIEIVAVAHHRRRPAYWKNR